MYLQMCSTPHGAVGALCLALLIYSWDPSFGHNCLCICLHETFLEHSANGFRTSLREADVEYLKATLVGHPELILRFFKRALPHSEHLRDLEKANKVIEASAREQQEEKDLKQAATPQENSIQAKEISAEKETDNTAYQRPEEVYLKFSLPPISEDDLEIIRERENKQRETKQGGRGAPEYSEELFELELQDHLWSQAKGKYPSMWTCFFVLEDLIDSVVVSSGSDSDVEEFPHLPVRMKLAAEVPARGPHPWKAFTWAGILAELPGYAEEFTKSLRDANQLTSIRSLLR
jgi:hypothetical protein